MIKYVLAVLAFMSVIALGVYYGTDIARTSQSQAVIRVGVLPDQEEAVLAARYIPLLDYLNAKTGIGFKLIIPESYGHLLHLFANDEIDVGYFGGLTYVQAQTQFNATALVMRDVDTRFTSYFIARAESELAKCVHISCDALAGTVLSFGSRLSTSGHLMPRQYLNSVIRKSPESYFRDVHYSGAHDRTAYEVQQGSADLGVLNAEIFRNMIADGRLKEEEFAIIWETPPYPDYVWAVSERLSKPDVIAIRDAFLTLDLTQDEHAQILLRMGARSFLPAGEADFKPLKAAAEALNLLSQDPK